MNGVRRDQERALCYQLRREETLITTTLEERPWSKEGWEFPGHWIFRNCLKITFKGKSESEDSPTRH